MHKENDKGIATIPAQGQYSELINRIYRTATKLAKTDNSPARAVNCGDKW